MAEVLDFFTAEQVEWARRYHRPLYRLLAVDLLLDFALLVLLAFGPPGDWVGAWLRGLPFWAEALAWPAVVAVVGWALGLPIAYWRGYVHEKLWGASTQTVGGWFVDRAKGLAVAGVLTSAMMFGFLAAVRLFPRVWPAIVAPGAAAVVLALSFVAPVVLEPVFNRFRPLDDQAMAEDLRRLADRGGVPVREVLVADASRRTRKQNAYVSGLGKTRRVVLYDTLLGRAQPAEVRLIAAHELGHRRLRHVAWWTLIGMAEAAGTVVVVWALLRQPQVLQAISAGSARDPRVVPFVMLVAAALQGFAMPAAAALSRRWESAADHFALDLTADPQGYEASFRSLAISNMLDLAPPRFVYLMAFTHPTPAERIAAGRRWSRVGEPVTSRTPPTRAS